VLHAYEQKQARTHARTFEGGPKSQNLPTDLKIFRLVPRQEYEEEALHTISSSCIHHRALLQAERMQITGPDRQNVLH
jgi:hypothetical protein